MRKVIIRFNDGYEFPVICEEFEVETMKTTGILKSISFTGVKNYYPMHLQMSDIKMIYQDLTYKDPEEVKDDSGDNS